MWGNFTINVPASFGTEKLTWTIAANGKTTVIPRVSNRIGNSPVHRRNQKYTAVHQLREFRSKRTDGARSAWVDHLQTSRLRRAPHADGLDADDNVLSPGGRTPKAPVSITWTVFRAPGPVTFSEPKPVVQKVEGKMPPKATFWESNHYRDLHRAGRIHAASGGHDASETAVAGSNAAGPRHK